MSRIDDLIADLCPDGVAWKDLSDICIISNGKDHKHLEEGKYPVYGSGGIMRCADTYQYDKPSVLIPRKGSIGNLFYVDVPFWTVDTIFYTKIDTTRIIPKYFYYYLSVCKIEDLNTAGGVPSLTKTVLDKISIPIPPLPIQEEIVRILDAFTTLEAELEAELEARKKQYEYYRQSLLWQHSTAIVMKLGEVATLRTGSKPKEILEEKDNFEYINAGTSNSGYVRASNCEGDTVTTPSRGQGGIGFVGYQKNSFWLGPLCYRIISKDTSKMLNRYLYYYLSCFNEKILQYKNEGGTPSVNASDLVNIEINIPSIAVQRRIITILDRFDALTNDITVGLPAEIAARRKQYEYYRDKLLSFKEKVS